MILNDFYNESPTKIKTRQDILSTSIELFSQKGMDAVTMIDIANVCCITSRNLYRYYPSKDYIVMDTAFIMLNHGYQPVDLRHENLLGIEQLNMHLKDLYNSEKSDSKGMKQIRFIMYFDLYVSKLQQDNQALLRYTNIYRNHINNEGYNYLHDILKIGITDQSINITEDEIEFYTTFLLQSLFSIMMRTMIKEAENHDINGMLVDKQIEMMISYLRK